MSVLSPAAALRRGTLALVLAIVAAACAAQAAHAALYKWVDASGRTVYSDQPPPDGKSEKFNASVAPADPKAVRDLANKDAEIKKRIQQRNDDAGKSEKSAAEAKKKAEWCEKSRLQNKSYQTNRNLARLNEKGETVFLEAEERAKVVTENERVMREMGCPAS